MSRRGVPVFNAPGANANAVKELVLAGLLHERAQPASGRALRGRVARQRRRAATSWSRTTRSTMRASSCRTARLGVIGLGRIGSLVADAAIKLGMHVLGYDPEITVDAAWSLPSQVRKAHSIEEVLKSSEFVTLHVPLVPATRHLINAERLGADAPRRGAAQLRARRGGRRDAVAEALAAKRLKYYVCDFPERALRRQPRGGCVAAPGRVHPRGRRQLRGDGGQSAARVSSSTATSATRSTFPTW